MPRTQELKTGKKRAVTQADVAHRAGVSRGAASVVLNRITSTIRVSEETRQRIQQAAEELNYHPNAVARGLARGRMDAFGIVFPHADFSVISNPYFGPVLDGILTFAMHSNQNTTLFTGHIWSDMRHSLPIYGDGRCDGLLLIAPTVNSGIIPALTERGIPIVVINEGFDTPDISSIDIDDKAAARAMVTHLLDLGHRSIALLPGSATSGSASRRLQGYRDALMAWGIPFRDSLVLAGEYREYSGYERAYTLLSRPRDTRPTALFCGNDEIATGALRAALALGLRVPENVSITGFDDTALASACVPQLTTIRQPLRLLGEHGAAALLALIRGEAPAGRKNLLPAELIVRGSTGPAPERGGVAGH